MAIQESIELVDNASGPLLEAADAAGDFADAVRDASAAADVDASSIEDCTDAIGETADAADEATDAIEGTADAAREAGQDGASAFADMGEALQGMNAGLEIVSKVGKGIAKVAELAAKFGAAVIEAHRFNEAATAALDAVTGGRGEEALDRLTVAAGQLGISTADAQAQFVALRREGASNVDAEGLIALRADLLAVGVDAGTADAAVKTALDNIKKGTDAGDAIAAVAKGFGAIGDGANASAKRALTLTGAIDNARQMGERAFQNIAGTAGPALDRLGAKVTSVLDSLEESGAIDSFAAAFADAVDAVPPIIDAILVAWESLRSSAEPGLAALGMAWDQLTAATGGAEGGMSAASAVGSALGFAISTVANVIAGAVSAVAMFTGALSTIVDAGQSAIDAITGIPDALSGVSLADVGTNLVESFIGGMSGMLGAVISAAGGLGDAASSAIKSALGIASPSKVGVEIGENLGDSVAMGTDNTMPDEIAVPTFADLPPAPVANEGGAPTSPAAAAGAPVQITIIVQALPGQNTEEIGAAAARAARREWERLAS